MTLEDHLKLIIGDLHIVIAGLRAEIDQLKATIRELHPAPPTEEAP